MLKWLEVSNTCAKCRAFIDSSDISELSGLPANIFEMLKFICKNVINGCSVITQIKQLVAHEHICTHYRVPVVTTPKAPRKVPAPPKGARGLGLNKTPNGCITDQGYLRNKRPKPISSNGLRNGRCA